MSTSLSSTSPITTSVKAFPQRRLFEEMRNFVKTKHWPLSGNLLTFYGCGHGAMSSDEGDDSFPQTFFDRKQTEPSAWDEVSDSEEPTKRTPEDCKDILEAAEDGYLEMVRKFIEQNPSCINVPDADGYTALHRACYNNHVEVVKYLLEHGADVGARTNDGWQPIHSSAQWGNVQILRILCSWGADLNSKTVGGNTPFHLAVSKPRNGQLIEYLLFHDDVDIEAINDAGDSPYNICKRYSKHYKLWEFL